jgi:mono/diheme cytochrome c family protein
MKRTLVLLSMLAGLSALSFNQDDQLKESIARGKTIFVNSCVGCHMADGKGLSGTFPPLAQSDYLLKSPQKAIYAVKYGLQGAIEVNGEEYDSMMPEPGLNDQDVSDVMNYILNSWGNAHGKMITVREVQEVKRVE